MSCNGGRWIWIGQVEYIDAGDWVVPRQDESGYTEDECLVQAVGFVIMDQVERDDGDDGTMSGE